jgi:hypothetical protein
MVAEIIKLDECIDKKAPFQSKGDVATYYLKVSDENIKFNKYDADCIKAKLKIAHRIGDSFFHLWSGGGEQKQEMWILVETKGKGDDYFEQLEKSLNLFDDAECSVHGRFVGKNVPGILTSKTKKEFDKLQQKFIKKKGTLRFGNKKLEEALLSINKSSLMD